MPQTPSQPTNAADYKHGYEDCANDLSTVLLSFALKYGSERKAISVKEIVEKFSEMRAARMARSVS